MNVLSLPDEMLASVLKYKSSENLTKLRKVSSKIDSVARRYGLNKWKIDSLRIRYGETDLTVLVQSTINRNVFTHPLYTDLLDLLKYYFSKIRGVKNLYLHKTRMQNMPISNEVGEFLLGNDCKNITNFTIVGWDISINFNTMRRIMTKLKPKKLFLYATFTEFEFSDALIEGISFDCLRLSNSATAAKPMKLSLPYLARLCALKMPSTLTGEINNATVTDLLEFFKVLTIDMMRIVNKWSIVIPKGKMSVDATERHLSELKCFKDHRVIKQRNYPNSAVYSVVTKISNKWITKVEIKVFP